MDVPLFWKELTRMTDLGRTPPSEVEWLWLALSAPSSPCSPRAPLYFSMDTGNWSLVLFSLEQLKWHQGD
eukprot:1046292-Pelagomonas_calceolata.AAC.1